MNDVTFPDAIYAQAQQLLNNNAKGHDLASVPCRVNPPVPIQNADGQLHSWFVPVISGQLLVGFFQFLADGTLMRFSSFQRRTGELKGCPEADDWLDLNRIQSRAESARQPNETIGTPFLTFDRNPDRLVWAVPLTQAEAKTRLVYVIGNSVYLPPTAQDVTGGVPPIFMLFR